MECRPVAEASPEEAEAEVEAGLPCYCLCAVSYAVPKCRVDGSELAQANAWAEEAQ